MARTAAGPIPNLKDTAFISSASENTTPRNRRFSLRRFLIIFRERVAGYSLSSAG